MKKFIALIVIVSGTFMLSYGQAGVSSEKENPFSFEASYIGDGYTNMAGGLKTGAGFMGMGNIKIGFDTEKAGWWKGGSLFINGASIHGKSLSGEYLGDLQVASNIDAGEHAYLHELWFRQELGKVSFTVGLQDLNAEFMTSPTAGGFINSSFGVPPVIATGTPVPIFPLTGIGLTARWDISDRWSVQAAAFDGIQTDFEDNPYNINWTFSREEGILTMGEVHFDGRFKLGAYYHSANDNYGLYAIVDQPVTERINIFGQFAIAPKSKNENNLSIGLGADYRLGERHSAGLAATYAGLHNTAHHHETAIELYYKYQLSDNFAIQPDIQYIINLSGTGEKLANALVGILRLSIGF